MKGSDNNGILHRMMAAILLLLLASTHQCLAFLSNSIRIQRHYCSRIATQGNNEVDESVTSDIFKDEFATLVESHPLDDPEPSLASSSSSTRQESNNNNNNTKVPPTDPQEEWKWFYSKLKERNSNQEALSTSSSNGNIMEESLLRHWMAQQRKAFMKTLGVLDLDDKANWGTLFLSQQQKQLLDQVHFPWGHLQPASLTNDIIYSKDFQRRVRLEYKDWQWNGWYERLCSFVQQHGHTRVPFNDDDTELAKWTAEQQTLRRKMPKRRRTRLDELQFDWNWKDTSVSDTETKTESETDKNQEKRSSPSISQRGSFGRRVKELKEFRIANGSCNVPLDYPGGLGEWVERTKGRRSSLSPSSIQKLEALGLVFTTEEADDD